MEEEGRYYVVRRKAVPDVLLRVVETKRLLRANRGMSVSEATGQTGISRSSFYKYKEDIFPFGDTVSGQKITLPLKFWMSRDCSPICSGQWRAFTRISSRYTSLSR